MSKKSALQRNGSRRVLPLVSEEEKRIESIRRCEIWRREIRRRFVFVNRRHPSSPAAELKIALLYHDMEAFVLAGFGPLSVALFFVHMYNIPQ